MDLMILQKHEEDRHSRTQAPVSKSFVAAGRAPARLSRPRTLLVRTKALLEEKFRWYKMNTDDSDQEAD